MVHIAGFWESSFHFPRLFGSCCLYFGVEGIGLKAGWVWGFEVSSVQKSSSGNNKATVLQVAGASLILSQHVTAAQQNCRTAWWDPKTKCKNMSTKSQGLLRTTFPESSSRHIVAESMGRAYPKVLVVGPIGLSHLQFAPNFVAASGGFPDHRSSVVFFIL